jgi:hypothetical protein
VDDAIIISTQIIIAPNVAVLERLEGYAIVRLVFLAINIQVERKFVDIIIKSCRLFILSLSTNLSSAAVIPPFLKRELIFSGIIFVAFL